VIRQRPPRFIAAAASAILLVLAAFGGAANAATTRIIYIGDPLQAPAKAAGIVYPGPLTNTTTAPGGLTAVDVLVKNYGGQTINHGHLLGGAVADARPVNANFPPPDFPSLADGYTYAAAFPTSACSVSVDHLSVDCDMGTLTGGASFLARIVIATPATADPGAADPYWFGAYLAEGNATGTNQDNFFAAGSIATAGSTCSATANYFLPSTPVDLSNTAVCTSQTAKIKSRANLDSTGQGGFALIGVDSSFAGVVPRGYTAFGNTISANVLGGVAVPGGLQWTIRWFGTTKLTAVVHFLDGGGSVVIPFKNNACSAKKTTDCVISTSSTKPNATPTWFEATFITSNNGKVGGLF
jgi:hypothetical protein